MKILSRTYAVALIKNETILQAAKYLIVGGICTVLDFVLLYLLTSCFNVNYILSSVISFMVGTILNYFLCIMWIFNYRRIEKRHYEIFMYLLITAIGLGINTLFIFLFTEFVGLFYMISKALSTLVTFWWNFGARKFFLHTIK